MKRYELSASIICSNFLNLENDLKLLDNSKVDYIHFDVMDGAFVPRYGLFPELISTIRTKTDIPIDVHMMVNDPERYLDVFLDSGLNKTEDIFTIHFESSNHIDRIVKKIKSNGIKAGLALNPATPEDTLKYISQEVDLILIMGINPGLKGQRLISYTYEKLSRVKKITSGKSNIKIEVDGGVSLLTGKKLINQGADILVCGSQTIFKPTKKGIEQNIKDLKKSLAVF